MIATSGAKPEERICAVARQQRSVADARQFAEQALALSNPASREAAAMAVQEFAENLTKYGADGDTAGTIALLTKGDEVVIRVRNLACSREDGERVRETISEINRTPNVRELYRSRQQELFDDPSLSRVRLGLLRVAFEGGFRLSCSYEHPLLEIVAERS